MMTPSPVLVRLMASRICFRRDRHVVLGADRDGLELSLRADDVLQRRPELERQPAMRDDDKSDHGLEPTSSLRPAGLGGRRRWNAASSFVGSRPTNGRSPVMPRAGLAAGQNLQVFGGGARG